MSKLLVAFEDEHVSDFQPLVLARPVVGLRCGILTLAEKLRLGVRLLAAKRGVSPWQCGPGGEVDLRFHTRGYLARGCPGSVGSYVRIASDYESVTLINGRLLARQETLAAIDPAWPGRYVCGGDVVAANVAKERLPSMERHLGQPLRQDLFSDMPSKELDARLVEFPWDIISRNGEEILHDFIALGGSAAQSDLSPWVSLIGDDMVRLGKGLKAGPGVVIDASRGPVSIGDGVVLMANASIMGPVHIGPGSVIKMGAKIYGDTTIGPACKIGGEVAEAVFQGYSNKQHEGFCGHSYLGEWVNIGAGTDTSDMKNNYSTVKVTMSGKQVDSGELFVGLFMGDHSKSGIGTVFNTGTIVGVCCNVFGGDYPPKYIPSFAWGGSAGFREYDLEKAIETARRAMARRNKDLDSHAEAVLRAVFELTAAERAAFLE